MTSLRELPLLFDHGEAPALQAPVGQQPSYIKDHRKRLRARFVAGGPDAVPDYELLELVLFRAVPRQDVKPLAHRLLKAFGAFDRVIAAAPSALKKVDGVGDAIVCELKVVEAAAHRLAKSRVMRKHVLSSWQALLDYCQTTMAHRATEQFRALYLDRKNTLIADEAQADGTVDHVPVYPREIAKRALELDASALILVHNHPSGDPTPSPQDIEMTHRIEAACNAIDVQLHDHLIIGQNCEVSMRSDGFL